MNLLPSLDAIQRHPVQSGLTALVVAYLILDMRTPGPLVTLVNSVLGKAALLTICVYLLMYSKNAILAVLMLLVVFKLIYNASGPYVGLGNLDQYAPSEEKKMSQFSAFNQFPYTLEQEVVKERVPLVQNSFELTPPSFSPELTELHGATPVNASN